MEYLLVGAVALIVGFVLGCKYKDAVQADIERVEDAAENVIKTVEDKVRKIV